MYRNLGWLLQMETGLVCEIAGALRQTHFAMHRAVPQMKQGGGHEQISPRWGLEVKGGMGQPPQPQ